MIKKIVHLSDIHVRTYQYHDIYSRQFELFINEVSEKLKNFKKEEIRFALTGDLYHQKISISNEQIMLISGFLNSLSKIGKVIIIPGNHDFLQNNTDRIDSITPIVEILNNSDIRYMKDSGVYDDENVKWVVYSLYQDNVRPDFTPDDDYLYVGLFHSPIQELKTDMGFSFDNAYDKLNFNGCDLMLCGDIHKRQTFKIPGNKLGVMIGSLIQQDFGENIQNHGYGIYDVEENKYDFFDLANENPFYYFKIEDINDIENGKEKLLNTE